jgi:hypothetical protein
MAYTALVRAVFESAAFNKQKPPSATMKQLERSDVRAEKLWLRAQMTTPKL